MEKERGGLWPPIIEDSIPAGILVWSFFFLYTWILLLIDKSSFLSVAVDGVFAHFGLMEGNDHFGCSLFVTICVALVLLLFAMVVVGVEPYNRHRYGGGIVHEEGIDPHPGFALVYFYFVSIVGLPFYWIWRGLWSIKLHWLFDLVVIAVSLCLPWKNLSVILVYMYGVFSILRFLGGDDEIITIVRFFLLQLPALCALLFFVCFKHLFVA